MAADPAPVSDPPAPAAEDSDPFFSHWEHQQPAAPAAPAAPEPVDPRVEWRKQNADVLKKKVGYARNEGGDSVVSCCVGQQQRGVAAARGCSRDQQLLGSAAAWVSNCWGLQQRRSCFPWHRESMAPRAAGGRAGSSFWPGLYVTGAPPQHRVLVVHPYGDACQRGFVPVCC